MKHFIIILFTVLCSGHTMAQLEKVIVEKYYISDAKDASVTIGGHLQAGSTTYRIYVDLKTGSKLIRLFGNQYHDLKFTSDSIFFNHSEYGEIFGYNIVRNNLPENTTALDTWISLGQTTSRRAGKVSFGVLKTLDKDGSFIAGSNNSDALLTNTDSITGIPLTTADGNITVNVTPPSYSQEGFDGDTTIFNSLIKKEFNSLGKNVSLTSISDGIAGIQPDSNQILIAQVTTKGKFSFELNLEILDTEGKTITYVAKNSLDSANTVYSPYLNYPISLECACKDPHYMEFNPNFLNCEDNTKCKTRIVCGCTDSIACNFDPAANVNIPALCCYPGKCNDRDINIVCPSILSGSELLLYPNPAEDVLTIQISGNNENEASYALYDSFGMLKWERNNIHLSGEFSETLDVSGFTSGLYWVRVSVASSIISKLFMKK